MSDICKCEGTNCPIKESCYRFTATDSDYDQMYFSEPPIKDGKCEMHWDRNSKWVLNAFNEIVSTDEEIPKVPDNLDSE